MAYRIFGSEVFHPDLRCHARLLPPRPFVGPRTLRFMQRGADWLPDRVETRVEQVTPTSSVRIHRPPEGTGPSPALLWIHGGGFVMGAARQDDQRCAELARSADIIVAAVDYRLAPQHPYPAGLQDCYDAFTWLVSQPDIDRTRIAVGGASAGGGLAAAVALMARDRGDHQPALQLLAYPMLDDRTAARPDPHPGVRRLWDNKANHLAWHAYLRKTPGSDGVSALAAPARAANLAGLPPAWVGAATLDLLLDEAVDYARRLQQSGVPCTVETVHGAFHGFDVLRTANVARRFQASQTHVLRQALRP